MKKFNTKTLLIGILIVIGLFAIVFTVFGQKAYGQRVLDPPTDLFATVADENDVNLFWTAPSTGGSTYLNWDSGENEDSFGNFLGPYIMTFASKYDPVHIEAYDGWEIKKLRFWIVSPLATVKLKVMTGPDATEIYSQDVQSFNLNAWTEIDLTTPVTIDASQELWFGLYIDMPVAGPVMGTDSGPAIDGYGNMYYFQGTWWSDFNLNWNLQAFIESPSDNMRESLLGYNIYRDDVKINDNTHGSTSFVDENLLNGTYDYYVTAVYDDGESVPSNEIEVQVSQPVIAYQDSMALVDLYNNCDGPNWLINTLWLEGPVSEWAGVVTTGTRVTQLWLQSKGLTGAVPESIGDLTALKKMVLTTNPITSIPETIGNLSSLEMLWIGWTDITSVPESIGNLTNLNELHLGLMNNPLTSLPESFCNLESLEWLALGGNALTSLPSCFGNLSSLETLFIWGNQLTELPESFGNLQSLWHLNMDDNPITHLPVNFGDLDNLESMRMEGNLLTALPESFSDLENLEIVWGRGNQIEALPEAFGNLDSLTFINLSSNVITEFPASITDLASIRELLFDNNEIAYIPEDIGNLSTLKVLGLIGNNIPSVPESIGDLSALRILGLASNNIPSLPESFGYLTADSIYLNNNLLHELPSTMLDNQYDFLLTYSNFLQFGSVEPFIGNVEYFYAYAPQGLIGNDTLVEVLDGQDLNYTLEVTGENNVYQWYKDSVLIQGQNTNTLTLSNVDENDEGLYYLEVTNSLATDLILTSHLIEVVIGDCVPWTFIVTGSVHSITIPATADVAINGEPLQTGDWIGAFYLNDEGEEVCGGAGKWGGLFGGAGALVNAYGDDPTTNEKDGFADGENFRWKMYSCSNAEEYTASASYDPDMPNQGYFADLGASKLTSLNNAYCQYFDVPEGWSSVSSYVVPENPAVQEIMAPVVNDLILMRNLNQLYWPEEELNTIGDWDNASGYATKFVNDASFEICGGEMADENLLINEGWSYLPVPSACDVDVNQLFGDHLDDIVIVQDLIGTQVFWPALGIYTLENLIPGKAYKIKTNNAINVTFPACENKTPSYTSRNNRLVTPWGDFNMTPSSENVVVFAEAITNLMAGDVIAAFNEYDRVCGMMEITNTKQNHSLVLFGNDPTTTKVDGFTEAASVSYKLYRTSTGEEFALNVEYSASFENATGLYYSGSLAGIANMSTGITSIDEINNTDVKLYPNPANTVVNVKLPSTIDGSANVEIISLQGKTVLHQRIDAGAGMIDISHLEAGVYMVKISSYSFTKIEKLILQ